MDSNMARSLEVTNMEIPTKINMSSVKRESYCLVQSEVYVKTELREDESEFPVIAGTSYRTCSYDDIKFELKTEEPFTKTKCEDVVDELLQDPLEVSSEIKDEEHFPIDLDGEPRIKTKPSEGEQNKKILETNKNNSQGSEFNHQNQPLRIRNDSDRKDKKHVCYICSRTFTLKGNLDKHLRIHTGEKPFECNICKKSFYVKSTLDTHMLIHTGEKIHACDVCKKVFSQKSTLNDHKLVHSGQKSFTCNECDKSFAQKSNLVVHKRIHAGVKPYACEMCEKAFTQNADLSKHTRIHTGEKPFSCDVCTKSFADKSNLNRHKKIHKN